MEANGTEYTDAPYKSGMVSIIIPVHNVQAWLPETLCSVQAQTYTDWECICVDDGSTDGSADVVRRFAAHDSRIRLVSQANAGAAAARNTGLAEVRGEFLAFLDADDLMRPELLETCLTRLREDGSDICAFQLAAMYEDHVLEGFWKIPSEAEGGFFATSTVNMQGRLFTSIDAGPCNKVYRAGMVQREHLFFSSHIKRCEDASFAVLALAVAKNISYVGKSLYLYRQQRAGSQTSGMTKPEVCLDFIESGRISWAELKERGLLSRFGADNILHALYISFYYYRHLPTLGYVRKATALLTGHTRADIQELEALGALSADRKAEILQRLGELRAFSRWLSLHFFLRGMGLEKPVFACLHALKKILRRGRGFSTL